MNPVGWIVIILAVGFGIMLGMAIKRSRQNNTGVSEELAGVYAAILESRAKKERNLNLIISLMTNGQEITNEIVREKLGVSRTSVGRYLDELQARGKIEQIGEIGRSVSYRLKTIE